MIRKWLPLLSWRIVQGYRQADMDVTPIDMNNLKLCWQEINNKEVKGVFGLHWDEMIDGLQKRYTCDEYLAVRTQIRSVVLNICFSEPPLDYLLLTLFLLL